MNRNGQSVSLLQVLLVCALAASAVIAGAEVALGDSMPPQGLVVIAGAFAMYLLWARLSATLGREETRSQPAEAADAMASAAQIPGLELLYDVPAPPVAATVAVMSAVGQCPRGLVPGASFEIDREGRLSAPLCRTAVMALAPVMAQRSSGRGPGSQVSCRCPVADRHLTFSVGPAAPIPVS